MRTGIARGVKLEEAYAGYDAGGGYWCTNESIATHSLLLEKHTKGIKRVGSISSGGEVPLFVFLPIAESVIALDHSYNSLCATTLKVAALSRLGITECKSLLCTGNVQSIKTFAKGLALSAPMQKSIDGLYNGAFNSVKLEWEKVPLSTLKLVKKNLGNLRLIHGDIADFKEYGPFDCLYLSNALQYSGRNGKPKWEDIITYVNPGGWVLLTNGGGLKDSCAPPESEWQGIEAIKARGSISWHHCLYQRKSKKKRLTKLG